MPSNPVGRSPERGGLSEVAGGAEEEREGGNGRNDEAGSVAVDAGPEVL
jgi:hypothetical protein